MWCLDDGQIFCRAADADVILQVLDKHLATIGASRATGDEIKSVARIFGSAGSDGLALAYTRST